MVLVDSSIWIEASRRTGDLGVKLALNGLLDEYEATMCSPVRLEVLGGARKDERLKMELQFSCLPYIRAEERDYIEAVKNAWKLQETGITVPWNDLLIMTIARRLGCRVYAQDKHFTAMSAPLGVPLYKPGYGGKYEPEAEG